MDESLNIFRAIFENSIDAIFITTPDGGIQSVNPAACRIFGYTEEEIIKNGRNGILDLTDERIPGFLKERELTGKISGELRFKKKDGVIFPGDFTSAVFKDSNAIERTVIVVRDVAALKIAEKKLRLSEERYRLLSEQSGVGVALYSPEGEVLFLNRKALGNIGCEPENYSGKSIIEIFGKKAGSKFKRRIREVIRLEKDLVFEDYFESPSGKFWFSSNISVIRNPGGEIAGIHVISQDITERKLIEKQLTQTTEELRELTDYLVEVRETERTRIAHDLHDDLGQKLTVLNMDISWVKSRIGVQSRSVENKLKQMAELMDEAIESVQRISFGLRPSILDDLGLLPAIRWQVLDFHKKTGTNCIVSFTPNEINVDAGISLVVFRIIQEALTNITRHSGATKVNIKITYSEEMLEIIIKDNGSGITQENIESSRSFGLIGIRERARIVSGEVDISGSQGKGTRVYVTIPVG